jgi:hypothetical protein
MPNVLEVLCAKTMISALQLQVHLLVAHGTPQQRH